MRDVLPTAEDLTAVAEQAHIEALLDAIGYGQVTYPSGRMLASRRAAAAVAILRGFQPFRREYAPWPIDPELRVTTDTTVLVVALKAYFADTLSFVTEHGEQDDRSKQLLDLGERILSAVRPVSALLSEADLADLESTRDQGTGSWSSLASLLLHLLEVEREQRLEAVHADPEPPVEPPVDPGIAVRLTPDGPVRVQP